MFNHRVIFRQEVDRTINSRDDLRKYLLTLATFYYGNIKIDKSLLRILEAFDINIPIGGNSELYQILKRDKVFNGINHIEDGEYSSINIEFAGDVIEGLYSFVEHFILWLEENGKANPPEVVILKDKKIV